MRSMGSLKGFLKAMVAGSAVGVVGGRAAVAAGKVVGRAAEGSLLEIGLVGYLNSIGIRGLGSRDLILSLESLIELYSPSKSKSLIGFLRVRLSFIGLIASITLIKEVFITALREGI